MNEYFSHDYLTREDEKIKNLIYKYGFEGYGLFWAIVEMLYINDGYMQTHYERIAFELRSDEKLIKSIINEFNLFKIKSDAFTSSAVLHRIKMRKGRSATAKKAAEIRWSKEKAKDANAMQTHSDSNAIKERKERKGKERKEKVFIPPSEDDVIYYFTEKGYKKEAAKKFFEYYSLSKWVDSKGNKILNWKQKALAVWFKEENKLTVKKEFQFPR